MEPDRDLVGLSRQVLYEFEMIEFLAKRLVDLEMGSPQPAWRERFKTPDPLERHQFEYNAMLESLLIHVRALTQFLFDAPPASRDAVAARGRRKPGKLRDAFAEDYFEDPFEWRNRNVRGARPSILRAADLNRMSREIAHITYERAGFVEGGSKWSSYALYTALADVMERFTRRVDSGRVVPDFEARVMAAMPHPQPKRPQHPPMPFALPASLAGTMASATSGLPPRDEPAS